MHDAQNELSSSRFAAGIYPQRGVVWKVHRDARHEGYRLAIKIDPEPDDPEASGGELAEQVLRACADRAYRRCLSRCPTATIAATAGTSSRPSSVSAYSTDGGDVGMTVPRHQAALLELAQPGGQHLRAETPPDVHVQLVEATRALALRYQITFGVHAPPSSFMHSAERETARVEPRRLFCGRRATSGYRQVTTIATGQWLPR